MRISKPSERHPLRIVEFRESGLTAEEADLLQKRNARAKERGPRKCWMPRCKTMIPASFNAPKVCFSCRRKLEACWENRDIARAQSLLSRFYQPKRLNKDDFLRRFAYWTGRLAMEGSEADEAGEKAQSL